MSTNNPRSRVFFFFDKKSMRYSNSALFVLLVLGALGIDPVWCLRSDGPDLPSLHQSSSLSSSSASSYEGLSNEEPALAEGAPPPVIQGLPPNNAEADVIVVVDLMPRLSDPDEVTVDPPVQPPQIDDDEDDMNSIGPNSTDTEDESSEPLPSDPGAGGSSSGPEAVVVVVNLVGWSLAAVGAMCLFYGVLRVSRRASAWAWGPSSAFPQPLFFADPPTPSSQLLASSNSGETGMVVVYTPQPLEDRDPIDREAECSASNADLHAYQKLGAIAVV